MLVLMATDGSEGFRAHGVENPLVMVLITRMGGGIGYGSRRIERALAESEYSAHDVRETQQMERSMGKGSLRNAPCWCGSGLKYKNCHLRRAQAQKPSIWDADEQAKAAQKKKLCLVPPKLKHECEGSIVRAHSISKSANLKAIARAGHVYTRKVSISKLASADGKLDLELIGINRASTFTGFCSKHDKEIFSPLEDQPFEGEPEQLFLLAYRSIAKELFSRVVALDLLGRAKGMDSGKPEPEQVATQDYLNNVIDGMEVGQSDLQKIKLEYDNDLVVKSFGAYEHCRLQLSSVPPIMCSGVFYPEYDFQGRLLQDLSDRSLVPEELSVNCIATDAGGEIVLVGREAPRDTTRKYIESLLDLDVDRQSYAICGVILSSFENVFIAPDWWEGLPPAARDLVLERQRSGAHPDLPPVRDILEAKDIPSLNIAITGATT